MASSVSLPDITSLKGQSTDEQCRVLDLLFEPSPAIHDLLLPYIQEKPFTSYGQLISECHSVFKSLCSSVEPDSRSRLHAMLGSHPRLGAKKVDSAQSASEQAKLQAGDASQLAALNSEYEAKFPGLRYVVFVNGRDRPEIMEDMRERISRGDMALEEQEGIKAMCEIAKDRAAKLQG